MARPPNANAEETKQRILRSAARLFSARGIDGVGMREVAAEAGVSQPAVHHYFGSKEALHDAVIDAMYAELATAGEGIRAAVMSAENLESAIELAIRSLFRFASEHREAVHLANREAIAGYGKLRYGRAQILGDALLDQSTAPLAEITGKTQVEIRLILISLNFLASRYVSSSTAERAFLLKLDEQAKTSVTDGMIEEHLIHVAKRLLLP